MKVGLMSVSRFVANKTRKQFLRTEPEATALLDVNELMRR